jgi:hypothetical protein
MPVNPLQGGFVPTDAALEHQETTRQDKSQQINKTQEKQFESPVANPANTQLVQQPVEPVPVQQSQEAAEANYTDRESQGDGKQEEDESAVEEMEKKAKKSIGDLQKGLEQVAEGIEQLKELSETEKGVPPGLDQRLQNISQMGQKLVVDIEKTVEQAVDSMLNISRIFFETGVSELTAVRVTIDEFIADMVKRQSRIPTPELRDNSQRAAILRQHKQAFGQYLAALSQSANTMLEDSEAGLRQLLEGNGEIEAGFQEVNNSNSEGFKKIESGFRRLFDSITLLTDATGLFRIDLEQIFKKLAALPEKLQKELGSREALGLPERLSAPLWQSPEKIEQCWRSIQGNLGQLSAAMAQFGSTIENTFEQASKAIIGEGQIAVDCVNTDLGDIKADAMQTLSPSAAQAVTQILEGANNVENALDSLIDTGEKKHDTIKRGSTAKLPSHFNVRL